MQRPSNTKLNERGFASIVIALILIIVLALLTVGFAQLARREQQTTLDKQKAIQANYAAESGINNAYKDILSGAINDNNASSTNCMKAGPGSSNLATSGPLQALTANQDINSTNGVSYSCVLVQLATPDFGGDGLSPGSDRHLNFRTSDNLTSLTIHWGSHTGRHDFVPSLDLDNPKLPTLGNWNYPPVMEFSITPTSALSSVTPPADTNGYLREHTFTFYVYPSIGGSNTIAYSTDSSKQGQVVSGACNIPASAASDPDRSSQYPCAVELNGLDDQQFVMHYVSFYDTADFQAYPTSASGGDGSSSTTISGEPMIDVTGKARDVLKRLRVRLFINGGQNNTPNDNAILPGSAVEAQNLCKRIQAAPSTTDFRAGSTFDTDITSTGSTVSGNPVPPTVHPCILDQ